MTPRDKIRDAPRTREAVLDAAEELFAERGYDGVSLQEIALAAGVSRGTPSYFFGSKEDLYRAMLDRVMGPAQDVVDRVRELSFAGEAPDKVVGEAVSAYLVGFLATRPTFVRLIEWEAMSRGRFLGENAPHFAVVQAGLDAIADQLGRGPFRAVDPVQLMISIVALCFFPLAHAETLLRVLGVDARDASFLEARTRHVTELVLHGIGGTKAAARPRTKRR